MIESLGVELDTDLTQLGETKRQEVEEAEIENKTEQHDHEHHNDEFLLI